METRSSSRFSGVFTLKTQAEANELAQAVTTLVERGVNIFQELEKGTSGEIEDTLKAVIRYFYNFFFVCKNVLLAIYKYIISCFKYLLKKFSCEYNVPSRPAGYRIRSRT
jgi:hypothetical protein